MQRAPKKQRTIKATVHTAHGDQAKIGLRAQKLWSTNDGLPSLRSFTRCWRNTTQQHTMMRREHPNRTCRHKLCMRMQTTAHALLCTAKHDCTMNSLRTGQSRDEGEAAGLAEDTFTIWPVLSKTCQALAPTCVVVVEQGRHKHNT